MNIYNEPIITPENLVDITIQYRTPSGGSTNSSPTIFLRYGLINIQSKRIAIQEVLPYLKYLQIRATVEGQNIIATQFTNFKTVISLGNEAGAGFPITVQVANGTDPCAEIPVVVYIDHAGGFAVTDVIYTDSALAVPLTGFTLIANVTTGVIYALNTLTGVVGAATGDTCSVPIPAFAQTIAIQLNGVNIDATNFLTDRFNGAVVNDFTWKSKSLGAFCEIDIPSPSNCVLNFEDEYDVGGIGGDMFIKAFRDSPAGTPNNSWTVEIITFNNALSGLLLNFLHRDIIEFVNTPDPVTGFACDVIMEGDTEAVPFYVPRNVAAPASGKSTYRLRDLTLKYFIDANGYGVGGAVTFLQYDSNGVLKQTDYAAPYSYALVLFDNTITRIVCQFTTLNYRNDVSLVGTDYVVLLNGGGINGCIKAVAPVFEPMQFYKTEGTGAVKVTTANVGLLPYNLHFYKQGALMNTVVVNTQVQDCVPTAFDWDSIAIGTAAPPPFAATAFVDNQMGAAPGETSVITAVQVAGVPLGAPSVFPVAPLSNTSGAFTAASPVNIDVTISNTGVVPPTTVRVIDQFGGNNNIPYTVDGVYNFVGIAAGGNISVVLF
jgi:hypothetical protein